MKKVFYISDLDGTLLNSKSILSSYTRKTLERFNDHNVPFSIATGRSYGSMRHVINKNLNMSFPVITFDGALISSFDSPNPIYLQEIDSHVCHDFVGFVQKEGFNIFLDILGKGKTEFLFEDYQSEASRLFMEIWKQPQVLSHVRHVPFINLYAKKTVISLVVVDTPERISDLKNKAEQIFAGAPIRFDEDVSMQFNHKQVGVLWILSTGAHKELAIREFCSIKNIKLEDITFFGDNMNDLGVFSIPEIRKIAVANAIEPIRERANIIIETNDQDSVIRFVERDQRKG